MSDPTDPGLGGTPPPGPQYGAPQYGGQPQYQQPQPQQSYARPPRNPSQTLEMIGSIVMIAGCVVAAAGLIAGFLAFANDDVYNTTLKFEQFFTDLALGVGLGAIAVALGFLLKDKARRP